MRLIVTKINGHFYAKGWNTKLAMLTLDGCDLYECWPEVEGCRCKEPRMVWKEGDVTVAANDALVSQILGFTCIVCGHDSDSVNAFRLKPKWRYRIE